MRDCFLDCKKEFWKQGYSNFDDLNFLAVRILKKNIGSEIAKRFPFILIDECQDLSGNELEVLRQLKENGCCIHFIGDLNQSIYEFKRVSPDNIADYVKDFEKYTLSNNFRSCTEIVSFSEKLIGKSGSISQNVESKFGNHSLVYIEYRTPEEAIEKYVRLLDSMGCKEYDNKILVISPLTANWIVLDSEEEKKMLLTLMASSTIGDAYKLFENSGIEKLLAKIISRKFAGINEKIIPKTIS